MVPWQQDLSTSTTSQVHDFNSEEADYLLERLNPLSTINVFLL
jgi:hypothetical protein